jgi:hypothetical protein
VLRLGWGAGRTWAEGYAVMALILLISGLLERRGGARLQRPPTLSRG